MTHSRTRSHRHLQRVYNVTIWGEREKEGVGWGGGGGGGGSGGRREKMSTDQRVMKKARWEVKCTNSYIVSFYCDM